MKLLFLSGWIVLVPVGALCAQSAPLADHHQHLFSPEIAAWLSEPPAPPAAAPLPPDVQTLIEARGRVGQDAAAAAAVYATDAVITRSGGPTWLRGREAIAAWWKSNRTPPLRLIPVAWHTDGAAGSVAAYVTTGPAETPRYVSHVLLALRKEEGAWRIAAETVVAEGPRVVNPITAERLVALLDAAGIRRAVVLSVAYIWGNPSTRALAKLARALGVTLSGLFDGVG